MSSGHVWRRLVRADTYAPPGEDLIAEYMKTYGITRTEALEIINKHLEEIWINDLYQVAVYRNEHTDIVHLNIRRRDGYPGKDWRHFQQIKNELVGEECEGVELYPAESRKVDTSNKYHLYVFKEPGTFWPFGFGVRDIREEGNDTSPGLRQRPAMKIKEDK